MAIRFRSSTDEATRSALAQLQESISAQQALIQAQSEQIAALHAASESQQTHIRALMDQLQRHDAQLQAQLHRSTDTQQQLYGYIQRVVGTVVQHQNDLLAQLSDSLQGLSEQHADTEPIQIIQEEEFKPPESVAPAPPARATELDVVYAPVVIEPAAAPVPGTAIPPRAASEPRDSNERQLKVMRAFIDAGDRFVDYIGEDLPKAQVNRLEEEKKLERHKYHPYKLRPTPRGRDWFEEATRLADAPQPDDSATQPLTALADEEPPVPPASPAEPVDFAALADEGEIPPLDALVGEKGSDTAKLITLLMGRGGAAAEAELQAAFPRSQFVNVIIDEINERAQDELGDNLITESNGSWTIEAEYRPALLKCLNGDAAEAAPQADPEPAGAAAEAEAD